MNDFTTVSLPRTGNTPVRFRGRLLAEVVDAPPPYAKARTDTRRWFELRLFEHEDGRYIVAIGFRTGMETELPADDVFVCDDDQDVLDLLAPLPGDEGDVDPRQAECRQRYDPVGRVEGFPELRASHPKAERYRERTRRLKARIREDFDRRVGILLALADFSEEI